jgi:hypothetical protein
MATRAEIIAKVKSELQDLHFNMGTTDSAAYANLYHYCLNDALSQMGLGTTDGDLTSITSNQVRIASIGCQYYFVRAIVKKKISEPRVSNDQVSRDSFGRIMEFLRFIKKDWSDALSGADTPPEINSYSESISVWGSINDGGTDPTSEGDTGQRNSNELSIDEFGRNSSEYEDGDN